MEKLTPKHNHTLTDILKVCIFAIFLMMPFFTMLPTMLYYGFNEHAKGIETVTEGGWQITPKYETNEVITTNDIIQGNIYYMERLSIDTNLVDNTFTITLYKYASMTYEAEDGVMIDDIQTENYDANNNNGLKIEANNYYAYVFFTNESTYANLEMDTATFYFEYVYFVVEDNLSNFINYFDEYGYGAADIDKSNYNVVEYTYTNEVEVQKNITQLIEMNWNELWETNLYKWTNESILKEGLDNFTEVFGITNTSHITNLITYELIIVSVYIVIDIVLKMFTWLTHMIGNK